MLLLSRLTAAALALSLPLVLAAPLGWTLPAPTNNPVQPTWRGSNYIRLSACVAAEAGSAASQLGQGGCGGYHCTFSPLYYRPTIRTEATAALAQMAANNYTLVRVFIDSGDGVRNDSVAGNPATDTLGPA